jgi:hypothetical protein
MTDETAAPAAKTPEERKALKQKRELRRLRVEMKAAREKAKELQAERTKLVERYNELATEAGLPLLTNKGKVSASA